MAVGASVISNRSKPASSGLLEPGLSLTDTITCMFDDTVVKSRIRKLLATHEEFVAPGPVTTSTTEVLVPLSMLTNKVSFAAGFPA